MKGYSVAKATHAFLVEEVFAASEPPVLNCRIKFRRPWPPTSHKHWPFPWSLMSMFFPPPALTLFFSAVTGFCEYYRTCTMCCRRLRLHHNEIHAILKSFVRGCSPDSFWLSSHELHWLTVPSNPKFLSPVVLCFDCKPIWLKSDLRVFPVCEVNSRTGQPHSGRNVGAPWKMINASFRVQRVPGVSLFA